MTQTEKNVVKASQKKLGEKPLKAPVIPTSIQLINIIRFVPYLSPKGPPKKLMNMLPNPTIPQTIPN
jgi:hypothetical protein